MDTRLPSQLQVGLQGFRKVVRAGANGHVRAASNGGWVSLSHPRWVSLSHPLSHPRWMSLSFARWVSLSFASLSFARWVSLSLYEVACSGTDGTPIHRHMAGVVNRIGEPCVGSHCRRNQQRPVGGICDVVEVVDPPIHTPCDPRRIRPRYVRYPNRPDVDHRLATLRIEVPSNTHQVRQLATQHDLNRRATGERRVRCLHPLVGPVRFGEDGSQRPVDAHQIG